MKKLTVIVVFFALIAFCVAGYFLISKFSPGYVTITTQRPTSVVSPTTTQETTTVCMSNQLSATLSAQGAAGNIYASLVLSNISKTACIVELGNTVRATIDAKNSITHYQQALSTENFILGPGMKVYSQIHYPNGPQCQNGISPSPITFSYKTSQTTIAFQSTSQTGKLILQACSSPAEKTVIDIWPLSKTPITQSP